MEIIAPSFTKFGLINKESWKDFTQATLGYNDPAAKSQKVSIHNCTTAMNPFPRTCNSEYYRDFLSLWILAKIGPSLSLDLF